MGALSWNGGQLAGVVVTWRGEKGDEGREGELSRGSGGH